MKERELFILSKEAYIIDMFATRYKTEEQNLLIDFNNPEHQEFADFYWKHLLNNKHVIDFDSDTVFITGCRYEHANLLFGQMVHNTEFTKKLLVEMLIEKYNINMDFWEIEELIDLDRDFKTKEDIENWFDDQKELLKTFCEN